jgi:hypothetical protein
MVTVAGRKVWGVEIDYDGREGDSFWLTGMEPIATDWLSVFC